jgi:repressor LexA
LHEVSIVKAITPSHQNLVRFELAHEARNGQIVVARLGEEVTVKRFQKSPQGIALQPENPDFDTIHVRAGEPFQIEGLAVGLIRNQF